MTRLLFIALFFAAPAQAHVGHWGEAAGHDHLIAGIAIGVAIGVSFWGALKGKKEEEPEEEAEDIKGEEEAA
ncbi:MAG: hypothetical protein OXC60_09120 [Litoreibacter sp.]|nr:hypothetical protein [Litoreibacter sp.]MCY4334820.1 hypothetical protein [Litoreibacter sp.]